MIQNLIKEFVNKKNVYAVIGVSRNPDKYGHRVYKDLRGAGYKVYPINPKIDEVLGDKVYPDLESLPEKPDVVDVVVPPKITEEVVKTCKKLGIKKVWLQPGSESDLAIKFCQKNGIDVVYGVCVMEKRKAYH